jgi:photosystem II stability/assembly factor-like uncharacterized protein
MKYLRWETAAVIGMFLAGLAVYAKAAAEPVYRDLLDTPSEATPLAAQTLLNGVVVAAKRLVCAGQGGHIVYSDDQGKSWKQASVPVSSDLVALQFPTAQKGWAVGHDGVVLHSSDAGATWVKQFDGRAAAQTMASAYGGAQNPEIQRYLEQGPDKPFLDVWFQDENTGYIVGAFNLIFRTGDGGKNWAPLFDRIDNPKRYHLYAIRAVGSELYVCGEQGSLFRLDAASGRFQAIPTPYSGTYFGINGKPGLLILYGMRGNAFRSTDGGASWKKIDTGVPAGLTGSTILADGRVVLVSQIGHLLVSADNGATFRPIDTKNPIPAAAVAALDQDRVVVAGFRGATVVSIK